MPKLTDTQAILLSTAAQRSDGSLLPPPDSVGSLTDRIGKAVQTLIKRGLAAEHPVTAPAQAWRSEGDQQFGAVITDAGRKAIGIEPSELQEEAAEHAPGAGAQIASVSEQPPTKTALVLTLLRREQGATLAELVAATGWLPHTTRAALTGLRKKGHSIAKAKRDEATCYTIAHAA